MDTNAKNNILRLNNFLRSIISDRKIFDFKNLKFDPLNIAKKRFIQTLSINWQRFLDLCPEQKEQFPTIGNLIHRMDNGFENLLNDSELFTSLLRLDLLLLNVNLVYNPTVTITEFKEKCDEKAYVYRGESIIGRFLTPSIYRENDIFAFEKEEVNFGKVDEIYQSVGFQQRYNHCFGNQANIAQDREKRYSFYQQYAALSPYLDFTCDLGVAMSFAAENYDGNGCIYALKKDAITNNSGKFPTDIHITNYDHKLTERDCVNGTEIYYLTIADFTFSYALINGSGTNDRAEILDGCYVLIDKAVVIENKLICPYCSELFSVLLVSPKEKLQFHQNGSLYAEKRDIAADIADGFYFPWAKGVMNTKLKLAPDVVFRKNSAGQVILLKTDTAKIYNFIGSCAYILEFFKSDYRSVGELTANIEKDFINITPENILSVRRLIDTLMSEQILLKNNELTCDFTPATTLSKGMFYGENELSHCAFELTYRCNEKCRYCYCVTDERPELTTAELKDILDQLYDMNVLELTFTGGDLFVRKDTFEILKYAHEKGFAFNIFTNGIALSDSDLFTIKSLHPKSIHFSLHSHIAEKHDRFTQVSGSFEKTISVIKKCVLIGLPTNVKFTVTTENIDDVDGVLSLVENLGTTIQISTEVFSKNDGDSSTLQYSSRDVDRILAVYELEKKHIVTKCSDGSALLMQYSEDDRICGAGDHSISINPYGDVYTCNALPLSIGSVKTQKLSEIWNHSETLDWIRSVKWSQIEECSGCENKGVCNFCLGNAYTQNDGQIKKYDNACFSAKTRALLNAKRKEEENHDF